MARRFISKIHNKKYNPSMHNINAATLYYNRQL
jgi:hypothetical protein